jgi:hypothetical protein
MILLYKMAYQQTRRNIPNWIELYNDIKTQRVHQQTISQNSDEIANSIDCVDYQFYLRDMSIMIFILIQ